MPLHPAAAALLRQRAADGIRVVTELTYEEARAQADRHAQAFGAGEPVAHVEDCAIAVSGGAIEARLYRPGVEGALPVVVYFHGGGWVTGNLAVADIYCRMLANAAGCIVVSVNYRHAPEHRFPVPAEDAYAATVWASQHAGEVGGDATRLAVAGPSAGGNLAAVVALMARDRGGPAIAYQVLTVPVTNYGFGTGSYRENADGYGLTRGSMEWCYRHYLSDPADGAHPYCSPLRAPSLAGLPPAFVQTAEFDPLRDEGEQYAAAMRASGVPVESKRYDGMIHGFQGPQALPDAAAHLRRAFGTD